MKTDSLSARIACAPALQSLYAKFRRIPLLGSLSHKVARLVLPFGTKMTTRVGMGRGEGLVLLVDPRYEAQYAAGLHESALLECLAAHLKPGDVFYDVGGHIGFISMVGARLVGEKGMVFSFEADPENASRILGHVQTNLLSQIEIVRAAVWSECKKLSFHKASTASNRSQGAVAGTADDADGFITVEAVTLDDFALNHRPPTVVKIDVEGAEGEVLKGAEKVFRTHQPTLICEIHHARAEKQVLNLLESAGYEWRWLEAEVEFPRHLIAQPVTARFERQRVL